MSKFYGKKIIALSLLIISVIGTVPNLVNAISYETTYYTDIYTVNISDNDAYYLFSYDFSNNSTLGYLKSSSYDCYAGFQFENITIPVNATIEYVYISLYGSDAVDNNNYYTTIKGVNMVTPYGFVTYADFINADLFDSYVNWNTKDLEGGNWKNSTNIKTVFDDIVNGGYWSNNTAMQFIFQSAQASSNYRSFRTYDYGSHEYAPKLYVVYSITTENTNENPPDSLEDLNYDYYNIISQDNSTGYTLWEMTNTTSISGFRYDNFWYDAEHGSNYTTISSSYDSDNAMSYRYAIKEYNGAYYTVLGDWASSIWKLYLYKSVDEGRTWTYVKQVGAGSGYSNVNYAYDIDSWGAFMIITSTGSYGSLYYDVHNVTTGSTIKSFSTIFTGDSNTIGVLYMGKELINQGKAWLTVENNPNGELYTHSSYTGSWTKRVNLHSYGLYATVAKSGEFFETETGIEAYLMYGTVSSDGSTASWSGRWVYEDYTMESGQSITGTTLYRNISPSTTYNNDTNTIAITYVSSGRFIYYKTREATPLGTISSAVLIANRTVYTSDDITSSIEYDTQYTANNRYTVMITLPTTKRIDIFSVSGSSVSLLNTYTTPKLYGGGMPTYILNQVYLDSGSTSYVIVNPEGEIVWEGDDIPDWFGYTDPELISISLNEKTNGTYWMFKGEVYNITAIFNNTQIAEFNFTDGVHNILFYYNNFTKSQRVYVYNATGTLINENVINGISFNKSYNDTIITASWKFMLSSNVVDILDTSMYYNLSYCNSTTEIEIIEYSGTSNLSFNVYNLGGFVNYSFVGDGGHTIGGSPFELYATNSSLVNGTESYSEITYRRLQLVHMLVELNTDDKVESGTEHLEPLSNVGYYEFGIDYKVDGKEDEDWIEGWKCRIYISEIAVGTNGAFSDDAYVRMIVLWYNHGDLIRGDEYIYSYHNGYDKTRFPSDKQSITFWVDMWFDKTNSSTVLGGRVNAEYYGYFEDGVSYWFGYGGFRPMTGNVTSSMLFDNILDGNGEIISSKQIGLVRAWERVKKTASAGDNNTYTVKPFQIFETQHAQDRMEGINTPTFIEPKQLNLAGYSMLDPLLSILGGMGTVISNAIFGVGKMVISGIDTVLSWVGLPYGTFSTFVNMVMIIFNDLISSLATTISMISKGIELMLTFLTTIVTFVDYIISGILFFGVDIFSIPIQFIALIMAVLNGGTITFYGIYLDFTPYASLMTGLKTILPLFSSIMLTIWIFWGNFTMNGEPDVIGAVGRIFKLFAYAQEIFTTVFWIFNRIRNELISIYNFLRSHIPFLGGGSGGTVEE